MQTLQVNWSDSVSEVLARYPQWQLRVFEAISKPPFDMSYCPTVVEIFDQYGLLAGRICDSYSYETTRHIHEKSDFFAWLFDGEIAVFYVDDEMIINRIEF